MMQVDWDCVEYPHGKSSKPRDPVEYIQEFKMEEVADLLWIGGIAAKHATADWRAAWGHLRAACQHYLFGFNATQHESRMAHARLYSFAELCEKAVIRGQVSTNRMLTCTIPVCYESVLLKGSYR
jgi:hypothetical protein